MLLDTVTVTVVYFYSTLKLLTDTWYKIRTKSFYLQLFNSLEVLFGINPLIRFLCDTHIATLVG